MRHHRTVVVVAVRGSLDLAMVIVDNIVVVGVECR